MKNQASHLVNEILEFLWMENPVEATMAGVHRYDDRLERLDVVSRRNKLRRKKEYVELISRLQKSRSSTVALDLLRDSLEVGIRMEETLQSLDRDAATYPRLALYGVYQLVARSSEPYHYRALRAIDRLREIPRILSEGKLSLSYGKNIPRLWTQAAVELTVSGKNYLSQLIGMLTEEVPELESVIRKYTDRALAAFDDYLEFLLDELRPRSNGAFSVGEELFEYLARHEHHLDLEPGRLRGLALEEFQQTAEELKDLASRMKGAGSWRQKLSTLDRDKPKGNLVEHWKRIISEVRRSVRRANLVTLPAGGELVLIQTPPFERFVIPAAGYIQAPPFEQDRKAFFCITPPVEDTEKGDKEAIINLHSRPKALLTVIRELYPGRHTLLTRRNKEGTILAYLARGNILEEGWCSYVLGLVVKQGLLDDQGLALAALHHRLLTACRVLIDYDLHNKGLKESRAVLRLASQAGIPERHAWLEVRRLALNPTSSLGALFGRMKIETMRQCYGKAAGAEFSEKKFHDALLRASTLPLPRVEGRLLQGLKKRRG